MDKLRDLIEQSRHWASVDRGLTLFKLVAEFFQDTLSIDAGLFIYKKQFILDGNKSTFRVYEPWGLNHSSSELTSYLHNKSPLIAEEKLRFRERWVSIDQVSEVLSPIWGESDIQYIGSWPLIVKETVAGGVVLGQKTLPTATDGNFMSLCSTYISFVAEMLSLRRVAEFHSQHEPLTGLLNRRGFEERFNQLSSDRQSRTPLLIGILDINDFKTINDTHGHIKGDLVLQEVALTLKEHIGSNGICARFGGDEFVFAIESPHKTTEVVTADIKSSFAEKDYSVSLGCAIWNEDGFDWKSCFDIADKRLYNGKTLDTL